MTEPDPQPAVGQQPGSAVSRRWFIAGGAAAVLGAGTGLIAGTLGDDGPAPPGVVVAPPELLAAIEAERALLADIDATAERGDVIIPIIEARENHQAHLTALRKVVASMTGARAPRLTPVAGRVRTLSQLRAAERAAAEAAAQHAAALDGPTAALLASISACEATHAELLR